MPITHDAFEGESPILPDGRQWAWNSSSLNPAKACDREYLYRVRRGLSPKEKSVDLIFGLWYAQALERYHRWRTAGNEHCFSVRFTIRDLLQWSYGWQSSDPNKNRETLVRSVIWYLDEFEDDTCKTVILANGKPAVELPFRFQVAEDIYLTGHLDRLVEHGGDIYVQDQKTTRRTLGSYYFKKFDLDVQMSLYAYAAKVIFHTPVKGVLIDAAQIAVGFTRFARGYTFRTDAQLDEWLADTIWAIKQTWHARHVDYPMNDSACMRYGGCDFFDVCSKPASVREQYLRADFVEHFRNPLGE